MSGQDPTVIHFPSQTSLIVPSGSTLTVAGTLAVTGTAAYTGTQTFDEIAGNDASLGISGLAAAQGGAVAVVGGTSSTAGNAGGAITLTGGTPGATGVGGGITIAAGAGGATSGNGGAASVTGGAGTNGNGVGGAASLVGGAGNGAGAGGAIAITSGAAGATGVAGAVAISVGGATAGNGSAVTITGGNGAGGTASGGNVNLVGGTAVSTGQPGEVQVNGDSNLIFATYYFTGSPAATDQVFFIATRAMRVKTMSEVHSVAAGGASTMTIIKDTGAAAPGAGTSLHQSGSFDLNGTANTVQSATVVTTIATANLAAGDRLAVKFANAIQSSAGIVVTVGLVPI